MGDLGCRSSGKVLAVLDERDRTVVGSKLFIGLENGCVPTSQGGPEICRASGYLISMRSLLEGSREAPTVSGVYLVSRVADLLSLAKFPGTIHCPTDRI